ncbi:MAG: 30S ribosomal protein S16 [Alphaproteobacteria bacterium]
MATRIRMTRHGSKKRPFYRIVAASTAAPRDGRFIEQLGHYDPTRNPAEVKLDLDRISEWIRKGAPPSDTVSRLIKKAGWKPGKPAAGAAAQA